MEEEEASVSFLDRREVWTSFSELHPGDGIFAVVLEEDSCEKRVSFSSKEEEEDGIHQKLEVSLHILGSKEQGIAVCCLPSIVDLQVSQDLSSDPEADLLTVASETHPLVLQMEKEFEEE